MNLLQSSLYRIMSERTCSTKNYCSIPKNETIVYHTFHSLWDQYVDVCHKCYVLKVILVTQRVPRESEPRNAHVGHAMAQRNVSTSVDVLYGTKWEAKRLKSSCANSASRPLVVFRRSRICIGCLRFILYCLMLHPQ